MVMTEYCWRISCKVRGVPCSASVSHAFLSSKKACGRQHGGPLGLYIAYRRRASSSQSAKAACGVRWRPTVLSRVSPWFLMSNSRRQALHLARTMPREAVHLKNFLPCDRHRIFTPGEVQWVAYLSPADNVSRPLPYRLRRLNQPVMSPPNWFSTPRSTLWTSIGAHASCSPARSSTGILF
jgi:hypothetical protein